MEKFDMNSFNLNGKVAWVTGASYGIGFAIALLLVFALVFTSVRVYRINSSAADIQYVADVSALAAEDVVCEYVTLTRLVDAVILSMSLTGILVYAVAAVVACIPAANATAPQIAQAE